MEQVSGKDVVYKVNTAIELRKQVPGPFFQKKEKQRSREDLPMGITLARLKVFQKLTNVDSCFLKSICDEKFETLL
jgi:hypothetical protein